MQAIYRPTGRAREYSHLACNLYRGCSHQCKYPCYVPGMLRITPAEWASLVPTPRPGIIEALRRQAPEFSGTNECVLFCFTSDPYSPEAAASGVTRQALGILRSYDIPWQILTKGGLRAAADFDLYGPHDAFATTMTFVGAAESMEFEPGAALPNDRLAAIYRAKQNGIRTWVSLEPVVHPAAALYWIERLAECVDLFKIGPINHDQKAAARIDWNGFAYEAMNLLNKLGKPFIFKKDLLAYCDFEIVGAATFDPRVVQRKEPT